MKRAPIKSVDIVLLRSLVAYDAETGGLTWLERPLSLFSSEQYHRNWNRRYSAKPAFTAQLKGYLVGAIFHHNFFAHRVCWALSTGSWPAAYIDHINGIKSDNRLINLRLSTHGQNQHNKTKQQNNTSGFKGVTFKTQNKQWCAQISVDGKRKYLGLFPTAETAHAAYVKASQSLHKEFARAR